MEAINDLEMFDEVRMRLFNNSCIYDLYKNDFAIHGIRTFNARLKHSLSSKLSLSSITKNIGYFWNEELQKTSKGLFTPNENRDPWIGTKYLVWSSLSNYDTWIYNKKNKIILEVTPTYPWNFDDPDEEENFITYEEFVKDYKPVLKLELSKERAQEWLDKTEELLSIMQQNYDTWRATCNLKED